MPKAVELYLAAVFAGETGDRRKLSSQIDIRLSHSGTVAQGANSAARSQAPIAA